MLFFYLRHGDPIYNPDSLTELGQKQAKALANRLSLYGADRIYASSSKRAIQTAAPTAELLKKEVTILDWCNEGYAYRDLSVTRADGSRCWCFQDKDYKRLFASPEVQALGSRWYDHPAFAGTAFRNACERIARESDAFFASLGYVRDETKNLYHVTKPTEERIALFAHQGFGLLFLSHVLGIPYPLFGTHFDLGHSSMSVIEFANLGGYTVPCMLQVSNDSHIYRDGLPLSYQNRIFF